jgi:hypothetical protein
MRKDPLFNTDKEHVREFKTLRRVKGHQHNAIVISEVVGVGDERNLLKKFVEPCEFSRRTYELTQVLDSAVCLNGVFLFEFGEVTRCFQNMLEKFTCGQPIVTFAE